MRRGTNGRTRRSYDVIDWLRPTTADRWRTYNIRDVDTVGVELTVRKLLPAGTFVQAGYTGIDVRAAAVKQSSKYVLDYARHSVRAAAVIPLPAARRLRLAPRIELKHCTRSIGAADYALLDARIGRRFGAFELWSKGRTCSTTRIRRLRSSRCRAGRSRFPCP
jgi:hypothetical protein